METHDSGQQTIAQNSVSGIIRTLITAPVLFLIVPFMVRRLGQELYGIWTLGSIVVSYASLGDLGLGVAVVKYTAELARNHDFDGINELINTTLAVFILIGAFITFLISVSADWFTDFVLKVDATNQNLAKLVLLSFAIIFVVNLVAGVFGSVLEGLQRMDLSNAVKTISVLLTVSGIYVALSLNLGIQGMVVANFGVDAVVGLIGFLLARRAFPHFRVDLRHVRLNALRRYLSYSLQIQAASLITLVFDPFSRILVANIAGILFLPFYDIASQLMNQIRSVFTSATAPLMPMLAGMSVSGFQPEQVSAIHKRAVYYVDMFCFPVFITAMLFIRPFTSLWLGTGYADVALTFQIVSVGWVASLTATPAYLILRGVGLPKYNVYTQLILVATNIPLGLVLGRYFAYTGIVVSVAVSLLLASAYLLVQMTRLTRTGLLAFPGGDVIVFLVTAILSALLFRYIYQICPWHNYLSLIVLASLSNGSYFVFLASMRRISKTDFPFLFRRALSNSR